MIKRFISFAHKYFFAIGLCLFMFSFGVILKRSRDAISAILNAFGISTAPVKPIIPDVPISSLITMHKPVWLFEPISESGNITLLELVVIIKLIEIHKPRSIFEIGTFDGRTTLNMATASPDQSEVFTLDLPKDSVESTTLPLTEADKFYIRKDDSGARYKDTEYAGKIKQLFGDSARFDFSRFENSMDFIFVDGSHSYEYVLKDSSTALRLLRNGKGIILWHDYLGKWFGATRALNELSQTNDFCALKNIQGTSLACLIKE